jgi:hypothetical protein
LIVQRLASDLFRYAINGNANSADQSLTALVHNLFEKRP